jgi:RimJ/RimL family protein N-acetyltransferase
MTTSQRMPATIDLGSLRLRRWQMSDLPALLAAITTSFDQLHLWFPWAASPPTEEHERLFLALSTHMFDSAQIYAYAVFAGSDLVGSIALGYRSDSRAVAELGYWTRSDRTGRGIATSATQSLTTTAFALLPRLEQVEIFHDVANEKSGAVAARSGYQLDREIYGPILTPGHTGRWRVWRTTRQTFFARRAVGHRDRSLLPPVRLADLCQTPSTQSEGPSHDAG